jgi:hypothetical protein
MKQQIVKRNSRSAMTWWESAIVDSLIGLCSALFWMALVAFARKFLLPGLGVEWVLISGLVVFIVLTGGLAALQRWGWHTDDEE